MSKTSNAQAGGNAVEHMRNRKKLLDRTKNGQPKGNKRSSTTASEAQFIQKSLQRTQNLLRNELQRVGHVTSAIDQDEKNLRELMSDQKSLEVKQAEKALQALKRAQRKEHHVLLASIAFFMATVFYIMWSRVLVRFNIFSIFFS